MAHKWLYQFYVALAEKLELGAVPPLVYSFPCRVTCRHMHTSVLTDSAHPDTGLFLSSLLHSMPCSCLATIHFLHSFFLFKILNDMLGEVMEITTYVPQMPSPPGTVLYGWLPAVLSFKLQITHGTTEKNEKNQGTEANSFAL